MPHAAVSPRLLELVEWVSTREHTYAETTDAWRTSCPRLSAREDAIAAGLVETVRWNGRDPIVRLTAKGRTALATRG